MKRQPSRVKDTANNIFKRQQTITSFMRQGTIGSVDSQRGGDKSGSSAIGGNKFGDIIKNLQEKHQKII